MSILIKGMNMPKCCCDCFLYDSAGFCALDPTREFDDYNHKCPDDCTLVEIPTPHGRLIDADRLLEPGRIAKFSSGQEMLYADAIRYAPTIVEAEDKL